MTSTKFTITQATRIVDKGRTTLNRHIKEGLLSVEKNDQGHKIVDASELLRVYGPDLDFDLADGNKTKTRRSESQDDSGNAAVKELNEKLIDQYKAQVETLKDALDKAQEGQNRVTLLLEKQTKDGSDWESSLATMTEKIANQTKQQLDEMNRRHQSEMNKLKSALHAERSKSFWKRLFG
jgi:C4-type Zn-finger protein